MMVNWDRLFKPLSNPVVFVIASTVLAGSIGLIAVTAVHLLVQPQSKVQFVVSVAGFAAFGLLASALEFAPVSIRASLAKGFAKRPLTLREKSLWFLAATIMLAGLYLGVHRVA